MVLVGQVLVSKGRSRSVYAVSIFGCFGDSVIVHSLFSKMSAILTNKLTIESAEISDRHVVMRVDYNVPLDKKTREVTDPRRIIATVPTINCIFKKGAYKLVLISHLGRPDGTKEDKNSLKYVVPTLEKAIGRKVIFVPECVGPVVEETCKNAPKGSVILLENLRFHLEEQVKLTTKDGKKLKADPDAVKRFRHSLSSLGDVYVNDAFGAAHRAHSSIVGIELPVRAAGLLMKKELECFSKVLEEPQRPLLAVLGGVKVSDKLPLIENLLDKVNEMIIGGAMAFTFKKVLDNMSIGKSVFDANGAKLVEGLMMKAKEKNVKIHLPVDFIAADKFDKSTYNASFEIVRVLT